MTESARAGDKRLVLGFDAGCGTCSDLAGRIQERIGEKLAVRNLRDPEVEGWREEALGKAAPWAPTLFEVEGEKVRAWVGVKMGLALSRRLGPTDTWRVMQLLGEIGAAPGIEAAVGESALVGKLPGKAQGAVAGMSRGQFLKGAAGAAVAATILSGGPLALSAEAAATSPGDIVKSVRLTGTQLTTAAQRAAATQDAKNMVGTALNTAAKIAASKPAAFVHTQRDGTIVRAVVYRLTTARMMVHFAFSKPFGPTRARSLAKVWQTPDGRKQVLVKGGEDGRLWRNATPQARTSSARTALALSECPPAPSGSTAPADPYGSCYRRERTCVDFQFSSECGNNGLVAGGTCALFGASVFYPPARAAVPAVGGSGSACIGAGGLTYSSCCAKYGYVDRFICK